MPQTPQYITNSSIIEKMTWMREHNSLRSDIPKLPLTFENVNFCNSTEENVPATLDCVPSTSGYAPETLDAAPAISHSVPSPSTSDCVPFTSDCKASPLDCKPSTPDCVPSTSGSALDTLALACSLLGQLDEAEEEPTEIAELSPQPLDLRGGSVNNSVVPISPPSSPNLQQVVTSSPPPPTDFRQLVELEVNYNPAEVPPYTSYERHSLTPEDFPLPLPLVQPEINDDDLELPPPLPSPPERLIEDVALETIPPLRERFALDYPLEPAPPSPERFAGDVPLEPPPQSPESYTEDLPLEPIIIIREEPFSPEQQLSPENNLTEDDFFNFRYQLQETDQQPYLEAISPEPSSRSNDGNISELPELDAFLQNLLSTGVNESIQQNSPASKSTMTLHYTPETNYNYEPPWHKLNPPVHCPPCHDFQYPSHPTPNAAEVASTPTSFSRLHQRLTSRQPPPPPPLPRISFLTPYQNYMAVPERILRVRHVNLSPYITPYEAAVRCQAVGPEATQEEINKFAALIFLGDNYRYWRMRIEGGSERRNGKRPRLQRAIPPWPKPRTPTSSRPRRRRGKRAFAPRLPPSTFPAVNNFVNNPCDCDNCRRPTFPVFLPQVQGSFDENSMPAFTHWMMEHQR